MPVRHVIGTAKTQAVRSAGALVSAALRARTPRRYRSGVTVVTVNWNSLPYLTRMIAAVEAMSPPGTEIVVVDNASSDGSREYLSSRSGIRAVQLPINVGHGIALDLVVPGLDTEYVAVLDIDAFPVSDQWLPQSIAALNSGAKAAGAHLHRNFVHPSFLVARTEVLHKYRLTFRPVGSLARLQSSAPLFLDVAEALCQRLIVKFGGGSALHFFEPTSVRGPGKAGSVFGGLVYHNLYATQGELRDQALAMFEEAFAVHHPGLTTE